MINNNKQITIGIIGVGRFGSLVEKIIREKFSHIEIIKFARDKTRNNELPNINQIKDCNVIIISVPISSFKEVVIRISGFVKEGTLVMDVCSVKEFTAKVMEKYLLSNVNIIATHPMFGPDSARYGLRGLKIVFWPVRTDKKTTLKFVSSCKKIGLTVLKMSPAKHDEQIAFSQLFTHLVGRIGKFMKIKGTDVNTKNFESLLEVQRIVTNDSITLFTDIVKFNRFSKKLFKGVKNSLLEIEKLSKK